MNKPFSKALSMILCLLMIFAQFPVPAHAHEHDHAHGGLVLSVDDGAVTLTHDDAELAHWPLAEGVTPSLGIGTVDGSFALLMQLDEPQLVLFKAFTPDALTLCGAFERVAVDSTLETELTVHIDEHSSIAHAELLGAVMLENAGTVEKLSAVETAVVTGSNLPENSLAAEDSAEIAEAAAKDFLAETAKAVELHQASNDKEHVIIIDASADEEISVRSAEPSELPELPVEEEDDEEKEVDAPTRLPCGHMSDANGNHSKLACGHYACAAGNHTAAVCGTAGHVNCDNADHAKLSCGHFACVSGDHTAAACGADGHYNCDGKTHETPDCGTVGHCISDDKDHSFNDGCDHQSGGTLVHYACDGKVHEWCDSCNDLKCAYDGDPADHTTPLSCGQHMKCSGITDHDAAACGKEGHYVCDNGSHGSMDCGHYTCEEGDHAAATCGTRGHYKCDGKNHTAASCEKYGHYWCDGGSHYTATCGAEGHYVCDGGNHFRARCQADGHCIEDNLTHDEGACGTKGHYPATAAIIASYPVVTMPV